MRSRRERRAYSVHACATDRVSGRRSRSRPPGSGMESSGSLWRHGLPRRDPGGRPTPTACASGSTSVDRAPATPPPCPTSPLPTWSRPSSASASSAARSSTPAIGGRCPGTPRAARSRLPPRPHPVGSTGTIAARALRHSVLHARGRRYQAIGAVRAFPERPGRRSVELHGNQQTRHRSESGVCAAIALSREARAALEAGVPRLASIADAAIDSITGLGRLPVDHPPDRVELL